MIFLRIWIRIPTPEWDSVVELKSDPAPDRNTSAACCFRSAQDPACLWKRQHALFQLTTRKELLRVSLEPEEKNRRPSWNQQTSAADPDLQDSVSIFPDPEHSSNK
jgi:hypothetical protein